MMTNFERPESVFLIKEILTLVIGGKETATQAKTVSVAMSEEEAIKSVDFLNTNAVYDGGRVEYTYEAIPTGVHTSWLVDLKNAA